MAKSRYSQAQIIQDYGKLFTNAKENTTLAKELAEYGYDEAAMAAGKALYDKAVELYKANVKDTQSETTAYATFSKKLEEVDKVYVADRKKARIIFKGQSDTLKNLKLTGKPSRAIAHALDEMKTLYETLERDATLAKPLERLKIDAAHIKAQLDAIAEAEKAYTVYQNEKGESQQATKNKDKAFEALEKWVREFFSIAKIALEDQPQLLESLTLIVKG